MRAWRARTPRRRGGDDASEADFQQAGKQLGPGPGTLLSRARAAGTASPGYGRAAAAGRAAPAWYAALGGLAAGMGIASLLMSAGCAWGLSRRIAEYR